MPFTETYASLLWCSPWLILGGIMGMTLLLRPKGSDGFDRAMAAVLFIQVIAILSYMGLCQRYVAEFYPFLVFAFLLFLRRGRAAFHLRCLIIGLVVVSVAINSLTTFAWLIDADRNVSTETKIKLMEFLGRTPRH